LFSNTGRSYHESAAVKSKSMTELRGLSVGQLVVALAGGENIQHLLLNKRYRDGESDSEVESG